MVVALSNRHEIPIYTSSDLKHWQYCSTFGPLGARGASWECPDLFELPVAGQPGIKKWVMIIGRGPNKVQYFTGNFNGTEFIADKSVAAYLNNGTGLKGVIFDNFENNVSKKWKVEGAAFSLPGGDSTAVNYLGHGFAGNLSKNSAVGRMTSTKFVIKNNAINFLIAGGDSEDSLSIRLTVDGKIVRQTTGDNSNVFKWHGWDVSDLRGKNGFLEIIDRTTKKLNGSIAVDHITFSDALLNLQAEQALWMDYGDDFYATRTWRNYDSNKQMGDSVILISWLGNWKYARISPSSWGTGFQSVPRNVALKKFPEGMRLVQEPIKALKSLRTTHVKIKNLTIKGTIPIKKFSPAKNCYEIEAVFNTSTSAIFGFNLMIGEGRKLTISYQPKLAMLCVDRTNCTDFTSNADFTKKFATKMFAQVTPENNQLKLHLFVDESSVEIFCNNGKTVVSLVTFPSPVQTAITVFSEKANTQMLRFDGWILSSIWK